MPPKGNSGRKASGGVGATYKMIIVKRECKNYGS